VDAPGGTANVRTTAMGLMTAVELNSRVKEDASGVIREYFARNASTLPDIYIAAAALDAAGLKTTKAAEWIKANQDTRNPDGSYGKTLAEHAGAVITILRLGGTVADPEAAAKVMKAAQQESGAWGDLSTTYRVMRALFMLKQRPDLEKLTAYIAKCRNADGGYGITPGQPSAASSTYFASIVLHWVEEFGKT
jgi:hypothetical protein